MIDDQIRQELPTFSHFLWYPWRKCKSWKKCHLGLSRAEMIRNTCFQSNIVSVTYVPSRESQTFSYICDITGTHWFLVIINGRGIMQKPRAQIINFENNRNINKSIVFVSLLIHYFATCICSNLWYVIGKP